MHEILTHPWMVKGFDTPADPHIPAREPLVAGELDPEVLKGMTGFEFGTVEEIEEKLEEVLTSELYVATVKAYNVARGVARDSFERPDSRGFNSAKSPTNKRFSGFDFYRKKLTGSVSAALSPTSPKQGEFHLPSEDQSLTNGVSPPKPSNLNPTRGFHPLVSIYHLVQEKIEREKVWGPGVFASSTLSLNGPLPPPAPAQAYSVQTPTPPVAAQQPVQEGGRPQSSGAIAFAPTTPRVRVRTNGEESMRPSTANSMALPTEDDFSRKNFNSAGRRQSRIPASAPTSPNMQSGFSATTQPMQIPVDPASKRRSVLASSAPLASEADYPQDHDDDLPLASQGGFARRFNSLLGRSPSLADSDYKRHRPRTSISGTGHKSSSKGPVAALPQVNEGDSVGLGRAPIDRPSMQAQNLSRSGSAGGTLGPSHSRSVSVGSATGAASLGRANTLGDRMRQSSITSRKRSRTASTGHMLAEASEESQQPDDGEYARTPAPAPATHGVSPTFAPNDEIKPVYLKGLFSVATTSTKPPDVIRDDIIRVLDRLGVQHRAIKSGFECAHAPSIDLSSVGHPQPEAIKRRPSRLGGLTRSPFSKERDLDKDLPGAPEESQNSLHNPMSSSSFTALGSPRNGISSGTLGQNPNAEPRSEAATTALTNQLVVTFDVLIGKPDGL